jgi:hypothetical protein
MNWADMIIELNQEFGIVTTELNMNGISVWNLEKSQDNLDFKIALDLNDELDRDIIHTICDEMRIPRAFFDRNR